MERRPKVIVETTAAGVEAITVPALVELNQAARHM
jgi:hypothetical protein